MRATAPSARPPAMAPMGIRLSPLGVAVFCLLGLGVLYHLYSGFLAGRFSLFGLGGEPGGGAAGPAASADGGTVDLREMLAVSVLAAVRGGEEVRRVRESNVLHEKSKGKTREGADDKMTSGDVLSNRKMFYLLKTAFPSVQVGSVRAGWARAGTPGLLRQPGAVGLCLRLGGSGDGDPQIEVLKVTLKVGGRAGGGHGVVDSALLAPPLVCASAGHRGSGALGSGIPGIRRLRKLTSHPATSSSVK